jgi:hypothetical protein
MLMMIVVLYYWLFRICGQAILMFGEAVPIPTPDLYLSSD